MKDKDDHQNEYLEETSHKTEDYESDVQVESDNPVPHRNKRKRKLIGFLVGFFGLFAVNGTITGLISVLPEFITSIVLSSIPLINLGGIIYFILLANRKMRENDPDKYFYKGIKTGLITFIIMSIVTPLLLIGGCFIMLNSY